MCTCNDETSQCVYRSEAEFNEERERQARASAFEDEIFSVLRSECTDASPRAMAFAKLLEAQPESGNGGGVVDILATGGDVVFWWSADGAQHQVQLSARRAIRLAA